MGLLGMTILIGKMMIDQWMELDYPISARTIIISQLLEFLDFITSFLLFVCQTQF